VIEYSAPVSKNEAGKLRVQLLLPWAAMNKLGVAFDRIE